MIAPSPILTLPLLLMALRSFTHEEITQRCRLGSLLCSGFCSAGNVGGAVKAVIFDIDGTLSDPSHRLHHVTGGAKNWPAFFDEMVDDPVNEPIRWLLWAVENNDTKIIITTGRPETHREQTEAWLERAGIGCHALYMRGAGDYRADNIVKAQILDGILADGFEVVLVVDDRQSVVDMWRERGLTCLQCRPTEATGVATAKGRLTIMVGPSGAGKTTWLQSEEAKALGILPNHVISSDAIRGDLCGDFRDQTRNEQVFTALHAIVAARLSHGLPAVVDATNIRRKDRLAIAALAGDSGDVRYILIDRPMDQKRATAGWRAELPIDLLAKHEQIFRSNLRDILDGDRLPNVTVFDKRAA
jgi:predicted kinase